MSLLIGRLYQVPQTGSLNRRHSGSRLEAGPETRVSQGRFLPRPLSGACVEGRPLPVSPHSRPSVRVCVLMSSSGAVPCHKALDSTPGTSCDRCHLFHDPISTGSHFLRSWGSARPPVTVGDTVRPSHPPQCPWLTGAQSHQRPPSGRTSHHTAAVHADDGPAAAGAGEAPGSRSAPNLLRANAFESESADSLQRAVHAQISMSEFCFPCHARGLPALGPRPAPLNLGVGVRTRRAGSWQQRPCPGHGLPPTESVAAVFREQPLAPGALQVFHVSWAYDRPVAVNLGQNSWGGSDQNRPEKCPHP